MHLDSIHLHTFLSRLYPYLHLPFTLNFLRFDTSDYTSSDYTSSDLQYSTSTSTSTAASTSDNSSTSNTTSGKFKFNGTKSTSKIHFQDSAMQQANAKFAIPVISNMEKLAKDVKELICNYATRRFNRQEMSEQTTETGRSVLKLRNLAIDLICTRIRETFTIFKTEHLQEVNEHKDYDAIKEAFVEKLGEATDPQAKMYIETFYAETGSPFWLPKRTT